MGMSLKRRCPECGSNRGYDPILKRMVCACDGPLPEEPVGEEYERRKREARQLFGRHVGPRIAEVELERMASDRAKWYD